MIIPERVYRQVEKRLRDRHYMVARARQALYAAQSRAFAVHAPATDGERVQSGSAQASRTEKAALAILRAEAELETALKWQAVFRLLDKAFPFDSPEGQAAELIYNRGETQADAALHLGTDRQAVRKRRDAYVCHAALMAAAEGLIAIREGRADEPSED